MPTRRELLQKVAVLGAGLPVVRSLEVASAAASVSAGKMRISSYEIVPVRVPMHERVREAWERSFFLQNRFQTHFQSTMIRLHTDAGLTGIGNAAMPARRAEEILKAMVGRSPWEYLLDDGIGGVLVAVCDLVGQATGLPVSRLFSSRVKERVVQTWWSQCFPPELMASEAKLGESLGYRVHKTKARPWEDPIEQAAAICEAVGPDFRVSVDVNAWWGSVGRTKFYCDRLAEFPNYFAVESPIPRVHLDGFRRLRTEIPLQLAEHMPADPMPFIVEGLLDAFVIGGPMGRTLMQRALMAEVTGVPLWVQHSIQDGINQVFQAHQAAAFPAIHYVISITHVLENDLMLEPVEMEGGFYKVPTAPGLGVHLDEDALDRYRVA